MTKENTSSASSAKAEKNSKNNKNKQDDEFDLIPMAKKFGKLFGCMLFGYMIGYTNMSTWWLSVTAFMWIIRDKNRLLQQRRLLFERAVAEDEKNIVKYSMQDLPGWVLFPDTERAEWLNRIFKQMWPFLGEYVKNLLKNKIEQNIDQVMPDYCKGFRFEKIDLGCVPLRLGSVKCYDENTSRDEIILDLELIYAGNCDIQVRIKGLNAGIKDFQLYGIVRIELKPLMKDMPLIGCVSIYFLKNPVIEFNFTNVADVLDFPGLSEFLRNAIKEQIGKMMVLPNKFVCPLVSDLKGHVIKFTQPLGVVRLEVIEARHLKKADVGMLGLGKSDPYVNIIIGNQEYKTATVYNTINPKWNFICETLAFFSTQSIDLEVMDEDQGSKDDFLGRISFSIESIMQDGIIDAWVNLKDAKTGRIHVRATWLQLEHSMENLSDQLRECRLLKTEYNNTQDHPHGSIACLMIYLDSLKNLPLMAKSIGEPSSQVIFQLNKQIEKSIVKTFTANPVWEENFHFLMDQFNPEDEIHIEVIDTKSNRKIGDTSIKMEELTQSKNMTHNEPLIIKTYNYSFELHGIFSLWFLTSPTIKKVRMVNDETIEERTDTIPAMEDLVKGTVEPIAKISGLDHNVMEIGQKQLQKHYKQYSVENLKNLELKDIIKPLIQQQQIQNNNNNNNYSSHEDSTSLTLSTSSTLSSIHSNNPMLKITINKLDEKDNHDDPKWEIIAHKARNLPKKDDRPPDSYVKMYTQPDRFKSKQDKRNKSVTIKNTCNPVYEERFLLDLDIELESIKLVVLSRLEGLFKKNKSAIGHVEINFSDYLDVKLPITKWFELEMEQQQSSDE
ncbi:Extended synaptotagmin-3 [Dermatophagoides pteronyssinus]|uniref:Extended synaptotagmin-3 n=1 Tax=Dermatophagoides pteronyssinus TaxID=6956 RepID=A0ABQ8JDU6_DERPT|nr:Extended synaptotagmin-3 [Dermatophagoides pteronyssinus]